MKYRIAVPVRDGAPVFPFLECNEIAVVEVENGQFDSIQIEALDSKAPDELARHLKNLGAEILLCGGIPVDILNRINKSSVNLVTGLTGKTVDAVITAFLERFPISHTDGHTPAE